MTLQKTIDRAVEAYSGGQFDKEKFLKYFAISIIKAVRDEVMEGSFVLNSEAVKGEITREKRIRAKFQEIIKSLEP